MISRRELFVSAMAASFADAAIAQSTSPKKMTLSIHQNTSRAAGYRKSLEGWAKAGIKFVEITDVLLDEFLKTDTIAAATREPHRWTRGSGAASSSRRSVSRRSIARRLPTAASRRRTSRRRPGASARWVISPSSSISPR
jgi:hypothetical protein